MTTAKRRASNSASSCSNEQQQQQQHLLHNQQHHQYYGPQNSHQQSHFSQEHHQRHHHQSHHNPHHHQQQLHQQQHHQHHQHQQQNQHNPRECSVKLPLDILWLPKSAMRPVGPDTAHSDCILVVGVSRPKLAVVFLTVMLISLFLTFHVLYDSAVYNIQAAQAMSEHHRRLSMLHRNSVPEFVKPVTTASQISHPMVFPSNRVHFPKTSRRLPQALIIGIRKCGTRALLEMLYLHPNIQKAGGEVHFFDRDENYMKGLEWYRKKMPHSFRGQITIEKSPSYFVSAEVPERVRAMNASIKLLLIVREPVTRAISDYTQLRSHAATATLPLASDSVDKPAAALAAVQTTLTKSSSSASSSGGNLNLLAPSFAKSSQSLLFSKLNGYSSAQVYDNSIDAGGGGSAGLNDGMAGGLDDIIDLDSDSSRGYISNSKHSAHRNSEMHTTTPATLSGSSLSQAALAQAQIAAKSFEELAIFPNGTVNESYRPLSISMYHYHLHRWLEVFPREQLHIVNGDRLIEDPVSELKKIESFLGIEHRVTSSHFYFNETKGFYCLRYDNGDRCLRETKGRKHPHVDPVVVSKLRKFFAEHNQRFYELIGEDLGWPEE